MQELSSRKKKILQSVIDHYIDTAQPVSSADVREDCLPGVSSATIRSELSTLEDMGYLIQPHISAGRIPSAKAYKYYVKNFIDYPVEYEMLNQLKEVFESKVNDLKTVMSATAKIISDETNYTSIVILDKIEKVEIRKIKLVDLLNQTALVIIVTDAGILKDKIIELPKSMDEEYLRKAAELLNEIYAGMNIEQIINYKFSDVVDKKLRGFEELFDEIFKVMLEYTQNINKQIYLEGTDKIFSHKEYENIENVKNFVSIINEKEKLYSLMDNDSEIDFEVKIGKDDCSNLDNMAMITARYTINGIDIGHAGVIGPSRMDYKRVVKLLGQIKETINMLVDEKNNNQNKLKEE